MELSPAEFAPLIPHAGAMNLLGRVLAYDEESLHAVTACHRRADHPLRRAGRLATVMGIEFAAQAMAIHGALMAGGDSARPGYLALVREVRWTVERLDAVADDLDIRVRRLFVQTDSSLYEFSLRSAERLLLEGRAAVFFGGGSAS